MKAMSTYSPFMSLEMQYMNRKNEISHDENILFEKHKY